MLVLLDHPEAAIDAYGAAPEVSPNRFNSLYGIGRAAEMVGLGEIVEGAYTKLAELAEVADTEREEIARTKNVLAEN